MKPKTNFFLPCTQFTGIGALGASSWVLHRSIQAWKNPTLVTANELLAQVNTFFGGTTGLYDLDVIYRIITSCSATCFVGGVVQFLMSMWLLLASETVSAFGACITNIRLN